MKQLLLDVKSYITTLNQQQNDHSHHQQNGGDDSKNINKARNKSQFLLSPTNLAVAFESFLKVNQLIAAKHLYIDLTQQDDSRSCEKDSSKYGVWSLPMGHDLLLSSLGQIVSCTTL